MKVYSINLERVKKADDDCFYECLKADIRDAFRAEYSELNLKSDVDAALLAKDEVIRKLKAALSFYADGESWLAECKPRGPEIFSEIVSKDLEVFNASGKGYDKIGGKLARSALKDIGGSGE